MNNTATQNNIDKSVMQNVEWMKTDTIMHAVIPFIKSSKKRWNQSMVF